MDPDHSSTVDAKRKASPEDVGGGGIYKKLRRPGDLKAMADPTNPHRRTARPARPTPGSDGQRGVFQLEGDSAFADAAVLEYMRNVRAEADGLAYVARDEAESRDPEAILDPVDDDLSSIPSDAAYSPTDDITSTSYSPAIPAPPATTTVPPALALRTRILTLQYRQHRLLHSTPPSALAHLRDDQYIHFPAGSPGAYRDWTHMLQTRAPTPVHLALLAEPNRTATRALQLCLTLLRKHENIPRRLSAWIWAFLARLGDRGELHNEEVGVVRELAKRAAGVMRALQNKLAAEVEAGAEADGARAGAQESSPRKEANEPNGGTNPSVRPAVDNVRFSDDGTSPPEPFPSDNTMATLYMILVVVGYSFGQSDLLEEFGL